MAVDATKPQGPSSDHQPETHGAGHAPSTTAKTHATTADASSANSPLTNRSTGPGYTPFSKLLRGDTDDIADFDDEFPVPVSVPVATKMTTTTTTATKTGKRAMFTDDIDDDDTLRPARRVVRAFSLSLVSPGF